MSNLCKEAGIPEPNFEQRADQFVVTIWREWLTEKMIAGMGLSDKQKRAIDFIKINRRITNKDYRELTRTIVRTASRDLDDLVAKGVLLKVGITGRSTSYVFAYKQDRKRTNRT